MKVRPFWMMRESELDVWHSLPKTPAGHIVHPEYAQRPWADDYIERIGKWLREHPQSQWPDYLQDYVKKRKHQRSGQQLGRVPGVAAG